MSTSSSSVSSYPESIASNESFNQDSINQVDDDALEMKTAKDSHAFWKQTVQNEIDSLVPTGIPISFKMLTDINNRGFCHQWSIGNYTIDMSVPTKNTNTKRKRSRQESNSLRDGKRAKSPSLSDDLSPSEASQSKQMSSTSSMSLCSFKKKDAKPLSPYIDKNSCQTSMGRKNDIGQKLQLALLLLQERKRRQLKM